MVGGLQMQNYRLKPLIGRDLFDALDLPVNQTLKPFEGIMINNIKTQCPIKMKKQIIFQI